MSERGSFVTEFIHCNKCLDGIRKVLIGDRKYLKSIEIPHWGRGNEKLPIIAGKIGGLYGGEELHSFEFEFIPKIKKLICHEIRIAVLAETGERIFRITPQGALKKQSGHERSKAVLKKYSLKPAKEFTFTVGEINAYLA